MNGKMYLPGKVEYLISRLNDFGYRADVVGGCVRDFLLGKSPSDYDITTSATPDEMKTVFSDMRTVETGLKHGTLTVVVDSEPFEITTYRIDGKYTDNRHPDSVAFTGEIGDDLSRRDFTVNAIAYNPTDGFTDLHHGERDLGLRVIRAVGDPMKRFSEDALRILRALRFASTLDFEIEKNTSDAIFASKNLLKNVSFERICTEWRKLIGGKGAYRILSEYASVITEIIPELSDMSLPDKKAFELTEAQIRELALFVLCESQRDIGAVEKFSFAMERLKSDNKYKKFGITVLEHFNDSCDTDTDLNLLLIKIGAECALGVVALRILLGLSSEKDYGALKSLLNSNVCYKVSDLKINGNDLASIGIKGKKIGEELERLLYMIAMGKAKNDREELLMLVAK